MKAQNQKSSWDTLQTPTHSLKEISLWHHFISLLCWIWVCYESHVFDHFNLNFWTISYSDCQNLVWQLGVVWFWEWNCSPKLHLKLVFLKYLPTTHMKMPVQSKPMPSSYADIQPFQQIMTQTHFCFRIISNRKIHWFHCNLSHFQSVSEHFCGKMTGTCCQYITK
jgi:hypothetical protein